MLHDPFLRIGENLTLGEQVFEMAETPALPATDPVVYIVDPEALPLYVARLVDRISVLERRVAVLESRTLAARWARFVSWVRSVWADT